METNQYLDLFLDESREHLQAINDYLLELENNPNELSLVHEIFRSAHTLKGMAATMGFEDIANLTHKMENVFDRVRNEELAATSQLLDILLNAVEALESMVDEISAGGDGQQDVSHLIEMLDKFDEKETSEKEDAEAEKSAEASVQMQLNEFERAVIDESKEQGYQALHIQVTLRKDCMLKAARVFMVFEVLEKLGEVIKSEPSVEKLEEENFDQQFSLVFITKVNQEEIQKKIMKVSEDEKGEV